MQLTGQMIFESQPHQVEWHELREETRARFEASAKTLNQQLGTIVSAKKKVFIHLFNTLHEEVQHMGCDEEEVPSLFHDERLALTEALYTMQEDFDEWDGGAHEEFSTSSLCDLALTWLGVPYRYAKLKSTPPTEQTWTEPIDPHIGHPHEF